MVAPRKPRLRVTASGHSDRSTEASVVLRVAGKLFAWSWPERAHPKGPRVPRLDVLAVLCPIEAKETILEAEPDKFFTTAHYNGYPTVLLRLGAVDEAELGAILVSAWRCAAPKALAEPFRPE